MFSHTTRQIRETKIDDGEREKLRQTRGTKIRRILRPLVNDDGESFAIQRLLERGGERHASDHRNIDTRVS